MTEPSYDPAPIALRLREEIRADGVVRAARKTTRWLRQYATGLPATIFGSSRTFELAGTTYPYLAHRYNWTWLNERAVEVPIVQSAVSRARAGRILEVGNVLSHYGAVEHLVVDLYERSPGVINVDVLDFNADRRFDLIVSVSTLEHIGWDERPRDPDAAPRAFAHLIDLLAPGGVLVATVPVNYNLSLDQVIREGGLPFSQLRGLRREERRNIWQEVDPSEVWDSPYDSLLCTAHGIVVCYATSNLTGSRRSGLASS